VAADLAPEHPNAALARRVFDAFGRRDGAAVVAALSDDVVWRVGGTSPVAGEYRGRREVIAFLRMTTQATDGTYRSELRYALADDERAVAVYRARGTRPDGRTIDIDQILLCRVTDGRLAEVVAVPTDQRAFDAFWS
jgi:ketosteroid isomerase-like protein